MTSGKTQKHDIFIVAKFDDFLCLRCEGECFAPSQAVRKPLEQPELQVLTETAFISAETLQAARTRAEN